MFSFSQAFYLLVTRGFQALPVFDKSTNQFVGFLKLADLLADIVDFCSLFKGTIRVFIFYSACILYKPWPTLTPSCLLYQHGKMSLPSLSKNFAISESF